MIIPTGVKILTSYSRVSEVVTRFPEPYEKENAEIRMISNPTRSSYRTSTRARFNRFYSCGAVGFHRRFPYVHEPRRWWCAHGIRRVAGCPSARSRCTSPRISDYKMKNLTWGVSVNEKAAAAENDIFYSSFAPVFLCRVYVHRPHVPY